MIKKAAAADDDGACVPVLEYFVVMGKYFHLFTVLLEINVLVGGRLFELSRSHFLIIGAATADPPYGMNMVYYKYEAKVAPIG